MASSHITHTTTARPIATVTAATLTAKRALASPEPQQRDSAFALLLPELLQAEPATLVNMLARQQPGPARDSLRDEMARQWVLIDRDSALLWIAGLPDPAERTSTGILAVRTLATRSPEQARVAAERLGVSVR